MALSDAFLQDLKMKTDINDIISSYVSLKRRGNTSVGLCPFHNEKTPSFTVYNETQSFYCFGCGAGGDALSFILKTENKDFKELIIELAEHYGIEMPSSFHVNPEAKTLKDDMKKACKAAVEFYQQKLKTDNDSSKALRYLNSRDINENIIKEFSLGWAPNNYHDLHNTCLVTQINKCNSAVVANCADPTSHFYCLALKTCVYVVAVLSAKCCLHINFS